MNISQSQSGYSLPVPNLIRPQPQLPQNANAMAAMIACVANGQSNGNSPQNMMQHHLNHQNQVLNSPSRIRVSSPSRLNSSSSAPQNDVITTSSDSSTATQISQSYINETHLLRMSQIGQLHRPFEIETSSKAKENS
jgi:hypothetical protein